MRPHLRTVPGARVRERGSALAELAMVIPLMLTLLLVVFDFGQGFLAYISISSGARDGARAAMAYEAQCDDASVEPAVRSAAQNAARPYAVTVTVSVPVAGQCQVRVAHDYAPILPFVTEGFEFPIVGSVGPLWDGVLAHTMVSQ